MPTSLRAANSPRFQMWIAMSIYSSISILAEAPTITFRTPDTDWAILIISISLIFSIATVIAHLASPEIFVGSYAEGASTMLLLLAWVTSLPVIVGPKLPWM